ncbi:MAG: hypothetical protein HQL56_13510 [Magnetococcales bacterium]|nr:hypothetical protein [Magnetococcales bacterium]
MSQPLLELQRLLVGQRSMTGRVVAINGGMAKVATSGGIVEVASEAGIQPGDRVTVKDGRAVKVQGATDAPVFYV